jgi:hypothetical protein
MSGLIKALINALINARINARVNAWINALITAWIKTRIKVLILGLALHSGTGDSGLFERYVKDIVQQGLQGRHIGQAIYLYL